MSASGAPTTKQGDKGEEEDRKRKRKSRRTIKTQAILKQTLCNANENETCWAAFWEHVGTNLGTQNRSKLVDKSIKKIIGFQVYAFNLVEVKILRITALVVKMA